MKFYVCIIAILLSVKIVAQNVGIGIVNPTRAKFEVNGAVDATSAIFGGESIGISLQRNWPAVGFNQYYNAGDKYIGNGYAAAIALDPSAGYLLFDMFPSGTTNGSIPNSTRGMFLSSNGRLGIGSSAPLKAGLVVDRTSGGYLHAMFGSNTAGIAIESNWPGIGFNAYYDNGRRFMTTGHAAHINMDPGTGTLYMLLDSAGSTDGLVTRTNGVVLKRFSNNSSLHSFLAPYIDNRASLGVYPGNVWQTLFVYDIVNVQNPSQKTNITPIKYGLKEIMELNPISFQWKDKEALEASGMADAVMLGLQAQDVKKAIPEIILEKGDQIAMRYNEIIPVLIKGIQEQQSKIEELEKKISLMEARLNSLGQGGGK